MTSSITGGIHIPTILACLKARSGLCPIFYSCNEEALMVPIKGRVEEVFCVTHKEILHDRE